MVRKNKEIKETIKVKFVTLGKISDEYIHVSIDGEVQNLKVKDNSPEYFLDVKPDSEVVFFTTYNNIITDIYNINYEQGLEQFIEYNEDIGSFYALPLRSYSPEEVLNKIEKLKNEIKKLEHLYDKMVNNENN